MTEITQNRLFFLITIFLVFIIDLLGSHGVLFHLFIITFLIGKIIAYAIMKKPIKNMAIYVFCLFISLGALLKTAQYVDDKIILEVKNTDLDLQHENKQFTKSTVFLTYEIVATKSMDSTFVSAKLFNFRTAIISNNYGEALKQEVSILSW